MPAGKGCLYAYRTLPYLLLFFALSRTGIAQTAPSYKRGTDTAAIQRLLRAAMANPIHDSAIKEFKVIAQKCIDAGYDYGAAEALRFIASRYENIGNYPAALAYIQQALSYAERSESDMLVSLCHNLLGLLCFYDGNYTQATAEYFKALDIMKKIDSKNIDQIIAVYTNLAGISNQLHQDDKTLYYLKKAEALARDSITEPLMTKINIATVDIDKGNYFAQHNMPDSAQKCYAEIFYLVKMFPPGKERAHAYFEGSAYGNLAELMLQTGQYNKAEKYCRQAIALTANNYVYIAEGAAYTLGDALWHLKKYKEAESVLVAQLKNNAGGNHRDLAITGYATLAKVYQTTAQYQKAADCLDTLLALKDSLITTEKVRTIDRIEAKYNASEKDRYIARNELLIAQQKNNIAHKNIIIVVIVVSVLLLIILLLWWYWYTRQRQAAVIKSLKQENTISILKGVVQGEENERIRLARDLHDGIGGMLSAIKMRFMSLRHDHVSLTHSSKYLEAMGLLDVMGDEIRKTSHSLMPEILLKQDLADALRIYCNNIRGGNELQIEFQSFGGFDSVANDLKLNIYRIVQELLKNIVQHAHATYAVVQLIMLEDYLTINIEDNGIGFDTEQTQNGIGLQNLKTRILNHEGHYTLRSEKGKGTTVYVEFKRS